MKAGSCSLLLLSDSFFLMTLNFYQADLNSWITWGYEIVNILPLTSLRFYSVPRTVPSTLCALAHLILSLSMDLLLNSFFIWWNCCTATGIRWDQKDMKAWPRTESKWLAIQVTQEDVQSGFEPKQYNRKAHTPKHHYTTSGRDCIYLRLSILPLFQSNRSIAGCIATPR